MGCSASRQPKNYLTPKRSCYPGTTKIVPEIATGIAHSPRVHPPSELASFMDGSLENFQMVQCFIQQKKDIKDDPSMKSLLHESRKYTGNCLENLPRERYKIDSPLCLTSFYGNIIDFRIKSLII